MSLCKIRRLISIWTAKFIGMACRLTGKQGVTLAGQIALKIYPDILKELAEEVKEKIFAVCGTNGKTTTNNLICTILEAEKKKIICNHTGSNMLNGVVSAFVLSAGWNGKIDADYACIEIDEASSVKIFPQIKPNYMILTNLFRDQLDRYGEIDITMDMLKRAVQQVPKMKIIYNGDDVLSASLFCKESNDKISYGISEKVMEETDGNEIREGRFCKFCGKKLDYEFYHYSQLGIYKCPGCEFKRPKIDFDASDIHVGNRISFKTDGKMVKANYRGFYNIYNILAAYAAVRTEGFSMSNLNEILYQFNPQNGRMEQFTIGKTSVMLNLAKNPAGFNQNIGAVMEDEREKDVIILINDNDQDGTDISWLWDVDFDRLRDKSIKSVTVSGIRCRDMRLRLKYTDISSELEPDIEKAIRKKLDTETNNLYVLVNYTGLYSTHNILKKIEGEKK